MVKAENVPAVSPFTWAFSAALREEMRSRSITQMAVADQLGRNQSYVSERTGGKRPCDTDIIAAIADLGGITPRDLVTRVLRRMKGDGNAEVVELPTRRPPTPAPAARAARKPPRRPGNSEPDA